MSSVNKVILVGRLGDDVKKIEFSNGGSIVKFPLATNEKYKNKDGQVVERTEWHNLILPFRQHQDLAQKYLNKGDQVYIEGRLRTNTWEDENQKKHYQTEVVVRDLVLLGSPSNNSSRVQESSEISTEDDMVDDLPF